MPTNETIKLKELIEFLLKKIPLELKQGFLNSLINGDEQAFNRYERMLAAYISAKEKETLKNLVQSTKNLLEKIVSSDTNTIVIEEFKKIKQLLKDLDPEEKKKEKENQLLLTIEAHKQNVSQILKQFIERIISQLLLNEKFCEIAVELLQKKHIENDPNDRLIIPWLNNTLPRYFPTSRNSLFEILTPTHCASIFKKDNFLENKHPHLFALLDQLKDKLKDNPGMYYARSLARFSHELYQFNRKKAKIEQKVFPTRWKKFTQQVALMTLKIKLILQIINPFDFDSFKHLNPFSSKFSLSQFLSNFFAPTRSSEYIALWFSKQTLLNRIIQRISINLRNEKESISLNEKLHKTKYKINYTLWCYFNDVAKNFKIKETSLISQVNKGVRKSILFWGHNNHTFRFNPELTEKLGKVFHTSKEIRKKISVTYQLLQGVERYYQKIRFQKGNKPIKLEDIFKTIPLKELGGRSYNEIASSYQNQLTETPTNGSNNSDNPVNSFLEKFQTLYTLYKQGPLNRLEKKKLY